MNNYKLKSEGKHLIDTLLGVTAIANGLPFGGFDQPKEKNYDIGQGIQMIPTEDFRKHKEFKMYNDVCYLYKDNQKISEIAFRKGGLFSGFKTNKFCNILAYPDVKNNKVSAWGNFVIIDTNGEIVFENKKTTEHPYYLKGVIAVCGNRYYNLETKAEIVYGSESIRSDDFLFVKSYDDYGKKEQAEQGVYKIEYATGNFEIFK